jgi:phospholipase C
MAGLLVTNAAKKLVTGVSMLATLLTIAPQPAVAAGPATKTPIQHIVVIFQENISFDHYFGAYPTAANMPGEIPWYRAVPNTPTVNGFVLANTNLNKNAARPFRLSPSQNYTCDQDPRLHSRTVRV